MAIDLPSLPAGWYHIELVMSSGGQFVARYQMSNRVHDSAGTPITYVVANPSSYAWPSATRPLPVDDAALLRRKYYDGWSTGELAADLGTTPKTIEHRLARLRQRLREIILRIQ